MSVCACVYMKQVNDIDMHLHKLPSEIQACNTMDKGNLTYQGKHIFPAASLGTVQAPAEHVDLKLTVAWTAQGWCWSVVKTRRTTQRMAVMWPTGSAAREFLLNRTEERHPDSTLILWAVEEAAAGAGTAGLAGFPQQNQLETDFFV